MIRLLGSTDGSEGDAARTLRQLMLESWPWAADDPDTEIYIITGIKCHGQSVRDLDLVVLGRFSAQACYTPFLPFFDSRDETLKKPDSIFLRSCCLVIEVKDSSTENIRFIGAQAEARYGNVWK